MKRGRCLIRADLHKRRVLARTLGRRTQSPHTPSTIDSSSRKERKEKWKEERKKERERIEEER